MTHYGDVTLAAWCRNSPATWMFVQTDTTGNIKAPRYWPNVGDSKGRTRMCWRGCSSPTGKTCEDCGRFRASTQLSIVRNEYVIITSKRRFNVIIMYFYIIKLPHVISRILIIHLLPIYFCTSSWYVRAAICLEGRLSLLALSSVYSLTVEDGSWSTPMVPAQLSVPL